MISDAPKYAPEFVKAGADGITFHWEAVDDAEEMIAQLRQLSGMPHRQRSLVRSTTWWIFYVIWASVVV